MGAALHAEVSAYVAASVVPDDAVLSAVSWYRTQIELTSATIVRAAGVVDTSSRVGTVGMGMIRRTPARSTYHVRAPFVHSKFKKSEMLCEASSSCCDSHNPGMPDRPGVIHGRPRAIAR